MTMVNYAVAGSDQEINIKFVNKIAAGIIVTNGSDTNDRNVNYVPHFLYIPPNATVELKDNGWLKVDAGCFDYSLPLCPKSQIMQQSFDIHDEKDKYIGSFIYKLNMVIEKNDQLFYPELFTYVEPNTNDNIHAYMNAQHINDDDSYYSNCDRKTGDCNIQVVDHKWPVNQLAAEVDILPLQ